ncbi:MAG: PHP domain-containing protein, partial [Bryobacteraceae bacterium]
MTWLIRSLAVVAAIALWTARPQPAPLKWYKGNLHTHTTNSDGDSPPAVVANWYKGHDYQFLVLSDHNVLTEVETLNAGLAAPEKFLLIPGEEVSSRYEKAPVHVNGFGLDRVVKPAMGASLIATIQSNVNAIREAGGLPSVNHPNFGWAFASRELLAVENLNLFEVYNGHPTVNNEGGGGVE